MKLFHEFCETNNIAHDNESIFKYLSLFEEKNASKQLSLFEEV